MSMKPILSRIAGVGLAALVAGSLLLAQTPAPKPAPAKAPAASGMVVAIDKESGTLRAPTTEELKALGLISDKKAVSEAGAVSGVAGRAGARTVEQTVDDVNTLTAAPAPTISAGRVTRVGAATRVQLDESFMEQLVAVRNPDGSITMRCVEGKQINGQASPKAAPKREEPNDR